MSAVGIHCTSQGCHVGLFRPGQPHVGATALQASFALPGLIDEVLAEAALDLADIDCLGLARGPGSFTGIKIGIATGWALGRACGNAVIGVESLGALALLPWLLGIRSAPRATPQAALPPPDCKIMAVTGAYAGLVYAAHFKTDGSGMPQVVEHQVAPPGIVWQGVEAADVIVVEELPTTTPFRKEWSLPEIFWVPPGAELGVATAIIAQHRHDTKQDSPPNPLYLRADPAKAW